jgi:hypothetical protein
MRVAEPREDAARAVRPDRVDQGPPQESERDRVHDQRAIAREPHDAPLGMQLEQVAEVEVVELHLGMREQHLISRGSMWSTY